MADLKHKKHIFFDLDDTLWDFRANSGKALEQLYGEFELEKKLHSPFSEFIVLYHKINLEMWSLYYKRAIDKKFMREQRFNEVFAHYGYHNRAESAKFSEAYLQLAPYGTALKEGCIELLEYLKPSHQLHIITNGFIESQAIKIDGAGLRKFFTHIIISEEHSLRKPEIEVFRLAEKMCGAHPTECVMIGDSFESDVEGAVSAGWDAIYLCGDDRHDYKGHKVSSLPELRQFF
jgi:putative hydrolase of the HAD superfamily